MIGFLAPWFLLAGAAVLVPLALHFLLRQESRTYSFPAIRHLLRTERDHARRIRSEQILLLLLRIAIVAVVVLLGARLHFSGDGESHDPTALAIVIDNSMSASVVEDGRRRLDAIKAAALESVAAAGHDDDVWVLRAGTPWLPAIREGAPAAREAVAGTEPSHGPADLAAAVRRAREIVAQSDLRAREVHLLTDMQASGLAGASGADEPHGDIPVLVFAAPGGDVRNLGVRSLSFDGGPRPFAGRQVDVAVTVAGGPADGAGDAVGVRLYADGRVRGAAAGVPGATVRLPAGPFAAGRLDGYAEIDSDALAADDRRFFALQVGDATRVGVAGPAGVFLAEALAVMEEHGRVARVPARAAAVLFSAAGEGLDQRDPSQAAVVLPGADPALLPALNRRLAGAGIPFSYEPAGAGGARVATGDGAAADGAPASLDDAEVSVFHGIVPLAADRPGRALLSLSSGDPWLIEGRAESGPFMLLASALDLRATRVPVSAAMIPMLEWIVDRASGDDPGSAVEAGSPFPVPAGASRVRGPDGAEHAVDAGQPFLDTRLAGFYEILAGDSVTGVVAVNASGAEMDLTRASRAELRGAIPGVAGVAGDLQAWREGVFRSRRGPEPWRALAALLFGLLAAESMIAAPGRLQAGQWGRQGPQAGRRGSAGAGG